MKLLKIGRASSNNLVLHSDKVSSSHAELLILDDGKMYLTDKNSTNGTFVGNQRLSANNETLVRRGDYIRFADTELNWSYIPQPDKYPGCKVVKHIGTMFRNDIVLESSFVSRVHATLTKDKNGKVFIRDEESRNGVIINGTTIEPKKDVRIKRGDNVTCGDVDITDEIKKLFPSRLWIGVLGGIVGAAAVIAAIIALAGGNIIKVKPDAMRPAVVYVQACYHYVATIDDNPMPELIDLSFDLESTPYQATAFFIDRNGNLATNRHVAEPWADSYRSKTEDNKITQDVHQLVNELLPDVSRITSSNYRLLNSTALGTAIMTYADEQAQQAGDKTVQQYLNRINTIIDRLRTSTVSISGEMDYIFVGYPGRYYTHEDELERCNVVATSDTDEKDIAILQLNTKHTPDNIKKVFDVKCFNTKSLVPLKDNLFTIGYPRGLAWAKDDATKSLEPEIRDTKCGKVPSKYTFELQSEVIGGASGSPVFDTHGRLVGVVWGSAASGTTFGQACQSKYLKELYGQTYGE